MESFSELFLDRFRCDRIVSVSLWPHFYWRTLYIQMGCVTIDGVMYSLQPYARGALSRRPVPRAVETVNFGDDIYRLIPVELRLNFDDEPAHRPTRTSQS